VKREQIIEMARKAGIITGQAGDDYCYMCDLIELDHFASIVADAAAAAEREECAKVCEGIDAINSRGWGDVLAERIRARGQE
jgi:hypothetical protein